jgi:NADH-quinone oxidoreductase subunit I
MTDVYEFSEFERENLIYRFATMTPAETEGAKSRLSSYEKEQAAKKAAAAAAPKTPAPPVAPAAPTQAPPNPETKV